jgi:hypothetical protein
MGHNETEEMTMLQNLTTGLRPDEVSLTVRGCNCNGTLRLEARNLRIVLKSYGDFQNGGEMVAD